MKILLNALFLVFILVSCSASNINSSAKLNEKVIINASQNTHYDTNFDLKINLVEDSRCPQNVQCPWAGFIKIGIKISDVTTTKDVLIDFTSQNTKVPFSWSGQNYEIEILEVLPYPKTGNTASINDYRVTLIVKKV